MSECNCMGTRRYLCSICGKDMPEELCQNCVDSDMKKAQLSKTVLELYTTLQDRDRKIAQLKDDRIVSDKEWADKCISLQSSKERTVAEILEFLPDALAEAQVEAIPNSAIYDIDVKKLAELIVAFYAKEK